MTTHKKIRKKTRDAIIQSLRAGVTPRVGQEHIQVGRADEVHAVLDDITRIADGGSGIRFVIGEYGSEKTFFLKLTLKDFKRLFDIIAIDFCFHIRILYFHQSYPFVSSKFWFREEIVSFL